VLEDGASSLDATSAQNSLASATRKIYTPIVVSTNPESPVTMTTSIAETVLFTGESIEVTALGIYTNREEDLTTAATWNSADPNIATVNDRGVIKAVAPGETTITVELAGVTQQVVVRVIS
jgi:hypothetical protein